MEAAAEHARRVPHPLLQRLSLRTRQRSPEQRLRAERGGRLVVRRWRVEPGWTVHSAVALDGSTVTLVRASAP